MRPSKLKSLEKQKEIPCFINIIVCAGISDILILD